MDAISHRTASPWYSQTAASSYRPLDFWNSDCHRQTLCRSRWTFLVDVRRSVVPVHRVDGSSTGSTSTERIKPPSNNTTTTSSLHSAAQPTGANTKLTTGVQPTNLTPVSPTYSSYTGRVLVEGGQDAARSNVSTNAESASDEIIDEDVVHASGVVLPVFSLPAYTLPVSDRPPLSVAVAAAHYEPVVGTSALQSVRPTGTATAPAEPALVSMATGAEHGLPTVGAYTPQSADDVTSASVHAPQSADFSTVLLTDAGHEINSQNRNNVYSVADIMASNVDVLADDVNVDNETVTPHDADVGPHVCIH